MLNSRHANGSFCCESCACAHFDPPSTDTLTLSIMFSPAHANPRIVIGPSATLLPSSGAVSVDFTGIPSITSSSAGRAGVPGGSANLGYRYPGFMKKPVLIDGAGVRRVTHFTQLVPSHPGTISRAGNP